MAPKFGCRRRAWKGCEAALQAAGSGPFCAALREVIEPLHIPGAGIRIASELGWITAELRPIDE